jgi:hypothetical protein
MQPIQLMTAGEFNTNNKQLAWDMMKNSEACQVLPEEHGGSGNWNQAI